MGAPNEGTRVLIVMTNLPLLFFFILSLSPFYGPKKRRECLRRTYRIGESVICLQSIVLLHFFVLIKCKLIAASLYNFPSSYWPFLCTLSLYTLLINTKN